MPSRRIRVHGTYLNRPKRANPNQIYIRICAGPQRGRYVHQIVAEAKIGRALFAFESVDHLDGNTLNNAPENLDVVHRGEHSRRELARLDALSLAPGFRRLKGGADVVPV